MSAAGIEKIARLHAKATYYRYVPTGKYICGTTRFSNGDSYKSKRREDQKVVFLALGSVHVEINIDEIVNRVVYRCLTGRSGKSRMLHGLIKGKANNVTIHETREPVEPLAEGEFYAEKEVVS